MEQGRESQAKTGINLQDVCTHNGPRPIQGSKMKEHDGKTGQTMQLQTEGKELDGALKGSDIFEILERQGFRCNLTGVPLTPDTASIDHIIPLSKGGSHTKANAQIILNSVNQAKGSMTQSEFVEMCRLVVEHFG